MGHLHNNLIQIAAERGLLGLACWLWIWGAYGYHTWRIYGRLRPEYRQAKALVVGSLASVIAFQIEGLFEYTFGDSEVITLMYFLMALPFVVFYSLSLEKSPSPCDKAFSRGERGQNKQQE
jgi:O-antigen ligase